jgi:hypothetical protein
MDTGNPTDVGAGIDADVLQGVAMPALDYAKSIDDRRVFPTLTRWRRWRPLMRRFRM